MRSMRPSLFGRRGASEAPTRPAHPLALSTACGGLFKGWMRGLWTLAPSRRSWVGNESLVRMAARADEREVAGEGNGGITVSRVDVIIPCYKYARYLAACVESVLTQDGVDVRALVIDDASPDETPSVAARLT